MFLLKIFFTLALILFPFGEVLRFDIGNNIVIKPLDIIVGLCAVTWFLLPKKKTSNPYTKWIFLLFPGIGFISLLFNSFWLQSNQIFASLLYDFRWIAYAAFFFVVLQFDKGFKKKIFQWLFFEGLVVVILGFLQYFFYNSLKNLFYLGWDEHMHRIFSTFFDPNFVGAFYVFYFLFLGATVLRFLQKKERKKVIMCSLILILTLLAIFLTFSRSAIIMLFVGSIIFLTLINKKRYVAVIIGVIILFSLLASPKFYDENMNLFRFHSSEARLGNDALAIKVIQNHPLIGVGFDSYRYTKNLYHLDHDWTNAPSHADAGVDNSLLFILATTGVIGLVAYSWMWVTILQRAYYLHKKKILLGSVVIASSIALFIDSFFINSLFYAPLLFWLWIIIGLMEDANSF